MGLHYISWLSEDSKDAAPEMFRSEVFYDAGVDASEMFHSEWKCFIADTIKISGRVSGGP